MLLENQPDVSIVHGERYDDAIRELAPSSGFVMANTSLAWHGLYSFATSEAASPNFLQDHSPCSSFIIPIISACRISTSATSLE